jgi:hypothetical protein
VETPEELSHLEEQALHDPGLCRELLSLANQETLIRALVRETAAAREFAAREFAAREFAAREFAAREFAAREFAARECRGRSVLPGLWRAWWLRGAAAAAALVACMAGFRVWQAWQAEQAVFARVVEMRGAVAGIRVRGSGRTESDVPSSASIRIDETLAPGVRLVLGPDGFVKLAYADGSEVEVGRNTALTLGAGEGARLFGLIEAWRGKRIHLDVGTLTAWVTKQKPGQAMALTTPHARATVLGTVLNLDVTPVSSELRVVEGRVELVAGDYREVVVAGESAVVRNGVLIKDDSYEDDRVLFQDAFDKGLGSWELFTKQGGGERIRTTEKQCPDIRLIQMKREGQSMTAVEMVGREAEGGARVGIGTRPIAAKVEAFSLAYEYTCEGPVRRAMEGIEICDFLQEMQPPDLGRTRTQMARPAGEWNQVRWECSFRTLAPGRSYWDSKLFFNGAFIGRRAEYRSQDAPGLILEVIDRPFRFANVTIREMKRKER